MILRSELRPIGSLLKTHGINGEIVVCLTIDVDLEELPCVVLDMDGIFVPFYLNSVRPKSSETDLVTIDGIDTQAKASALCGHTLYAIEKYLPESETAGDGFYADDLVGFAVRVDGEIIGKIVDFDDSTANYLFIIEKVNPNGADPRLLLPVAFVEDVNAAACIVDMDVPPGLLTL